MANDNRRSLYNALGKAGYDIGSYDEFDRRMNNPEDRNKFFTAIGDAGYDIGDRDEFERRISPTKYHIKVGGKSVGVSEREYKDFLSRHPEQERQPAESHPTWQDQMQETVNSAQQTLGENKRVVNRLKNREQRIGLDVPQEPIRLGENRKVTKGQQRLNPETGELENTYITQSGNEYNERGLADFEENAKEQAEWENNHPKESLEARIDSQIASLQQERNNVYVSAVEKARQENSPQSGVGKFIHDIFTPDANSPMGVRDVNMDIARQDKDVVALDVALRDLQDAKTMLQRNRELSKSSDFLGGVGLPFTKDWFNNWKNFGYGIWDSLNDVTINFAGINDMEKAGTYLRIKDKMERGEELTDSETGVALAGMSLAQAQQLADLPTAYTAGQTTTEMVPFMMQMAANPGTGLGKAFARKAVRQFGRDGLKAVTARVGARVLGNAAEAAVLSNTLQAGKTAADIAQRYTGKQFAYDKDGNIVMGYYKNIDGEDVFIEGGEDLGSAIYKGEAASIIENFTELGAGGSINGMLSKAAGSKLGKKIGLGYISDLVSKIGSTPFAKTTKRLMERTHWDGMIEEPLEEEYGIILNSLLTGDNKISDLWDSKQQADIFAGTMWFGGMMAGLNTAAYPFYLHNIKKKLNLADLDGIMAFGDEWDVMKGAIDMMDDKDIVDYLYSIKDNKNFTNEQRAALFGYTARLKEYQGSNVADMLNRMEGGLSEDAAVIRNSYNKGAEAETPDEMKRFADEADAAEAALPEYGEEFAKMVLEQSDNPVGVLGYMMDNREYYTDDQIAAAADYFSKKARADGMVDGAMDKVDIQVEQANGEVRMNTHPQIGMVIQAERDGQQLYVIGGDIVPGENSLPVLTGTGGAVVVRDAMTGAVDVVSPQELQITATNDSDMLIWQNENKLRQQLTQQVEDDIIYGSPAQEVFDIEDEVVLRDRDGNEIQGTIGMLPNSADGVFVVYTPDNKALQFTGDELNRMIVAHNGQEVVRANNPATESQGTVENAGESLENAGEINGKKSGEKSGENENLQGGVDNAGGEAGTEGAGGNNPSETALSKIPVVKDEYGNPLLKKGRPQYEWHKASVEDAADALIETTGGNMVMARDTTSDLVKNAQAKLEKIRKQKPKGEDPLEIAESRQEIHRAEQEQQAIIKQWQDVGTTIRKRMDAEAAAKRAAEEAAKSEEQRQKEAEQARQLKKQQDKIDAERRRKKVEEELANWNKPYAPLAKARREMESDPQAADILNDTEPRTLEEWVSSLIQPRSMMWDDETDPTTGRTIVGLQSELGLQKKDFDRIGGLVASREKGGKPFGQVVHDIWEELPEGIKNMYDDQDVRNTLLGLFGEGNATRMRHLTEEHRIEEAREMMKENQRREAEAEMDAWAEAYHLTPEERETFEDFIQEMIATQPQYTEQEDYEQNRGSEEVDSQHPGAAAGRESEGGQGQVQEQSAKATSETDSTQQGAERPEADGSSPSVPDNNVLGGIFQQPISDPERESALKQALVKAYATGNAANIQEAVNDILSYIGEGGSFDNGYNWDVEDYEGNNPEMMAEQYITRALQNTFVDDDEDQDYITTGIRSDWREHFAQVEQEQQYADRIQMSGEVEEYEVDNGTEYREVMTIDGKHTVEKVDTPDEKGYYNGSRYELDGEEFGSLKDVFDYIDGKKEQEPATESQGTEQLGATSSAEKIAQEEQKVDTNPTEGQKEAGNYQKGHIKVDGYDITIENPKGSMRRGTDQNGKQWEQEMHNTYGYIRGTEGVDGDHIDVFLSDEPTSGDVFVVDQVNPETGEFDEHKVMYGFPDMASAEAAYLSNYEEGWQGLGAITPVSREEFKKWVESSHRKTKPFAAYKSVKTQGDVLVGESKPAAETETKKQEKKPREHKRIVSDEQMEELRKKLLEKMNQANAGLDMERMLIGAAYAVAKIERGVTKFADFCADMVADFGDVIRPYLKLFYNGARDLPEAAELRPLMDDAQTVEKFDVFNFDKKTAPTVIEKAEQVVKENKIKQQAKKIKAGQPDLFAGDLFGAAEPAADTTEVAAKKETKKEGKTAVAKKKGTPWWNDPNLPQLDKKDYRTYMTPEARDYFASYVSEDGKTDFTKWAHPELAYITASAWDGVVIPVEELMQLSEIKEAEERIKTKKGSLNINDQELQQHVQHLLDAEHGSAILTEKGKILKVDDKEQFTGPVRQERKALLVIGLPAGGKSSVFANPLSNKFGARIIDSDVVKPWLSGYDEGYGAGYVQKSSSNVADAAMMEAAKRGDNMIIPRIGGKSVIRKVVIPLREMGYDVQLYWNDVSEATSIMRAASRFAEEGRYLSLDFLTTHNGKDRETFSTFAEKNLGEYYVERDEQETADSGHSVSPSGRVQDVLDNGRSNGEGGESFRSGASTGVYPLVQGSGQREESDRGGEDVSGELIFSYAEWKSNDVPYGEKPKEIWNSNSGTPLSDIIKENNNGTEREVSRESSSSGEGERQASGAADRAGEELGAEPDRSERSGSGHSVENTLRAPEEGEETRDSSGWPGRRAGDNARVSTSTFHKNRRNNVGERGKDYAPLSPKARFNANVEAVKMMRALLDDGVEAPTKDQMEVLRQYSGWGGLGTYFNDENSAENKLLREVLTDEEYNDAVMSANSAYYTPAMVIDTLWDIAKALGFKGGVTLEGSAGIGNIIGQMPQDMSRRSDIEAVEIDAISGNILKLLYPDAMVHIQGFQDTVIRNGSVDLAITNVPFVTGLHVFDKVDKDLSRRFTNIHDFCIAKNIRKLKEGGLGLFITSSGTLDKSSDLRQWIGDEGQSDVIGAFRLNNETFGGTSVTSDIIVVRKRVGGQRSESAIDIVKASPVRVGTYEDKFHNEHQTTMVINDYFKEHPEMMAGEMFFGYEKGDTFRPGSYGLYPEGKDQAKMMADFVKTMEKVKPAAKAARTERREEKPVENQLTAEKEGRMLIDENGRLCVSERGVAVPLGLNDQKVKGYSKAECFKDYQAVQSAVDDVLQQQLNDPDDSKLEPKLKALNAAYDKFTKRYGTLHKNTAISFLRNDIDFPSFQALENYRETKDIKGKVKVETDKAPVLKQRVLGFKTEPKPKSIKDALIASIFRSNGIDLGWITEKLNNAKVPNEGQREWTEDDVRKGILVSRLGFENPVTGQLEVKHQYLSGNVREKLAQAESYNEGGRYNANIEELKKVVPMDIPSHMIDFSLGSSWIPVELFKDFIKETTDLNNITLNHIAGSWSLDVGNWFRNEKNRSGGVYSEMFRSTIYAHQLIDAALNNRPYKVQKVTKDDGTIVDKKATQACNVRIDEIKDEFKEWMRKRMQDDQELSGRIEKIYNDKFNALVPMTIGDEFLPGTFEGANMNIHLYDHQKRGVMRGVTSPTMLAHQVGTGKSFTLITTAMEMRRLGTAQKPMIVVQNATVAQMTADAKLLYPNAKILSLSEKDRSAEGRRSFYAKIRFNDWDIVIVPQSTFERIPDSPERELQFIREKIDEKKHLIQEAKEAKMNARDVQRLERELKGLEEEYGDKFLDSDPANGSAGPKRRKKTDAKKEAASLDKAETRAREQLDRAVDDVQYFDDLGVDAILVDEAHEYKHLGFQTSLGRGIKGVDPSYSKKCAGLYNKTRCVFEKAGWKNVVFATGTPISNTAAEIWTFMKYLMPADVMRDNDIYYFDDFVHNFGSISQMLEFSTSGKFKENTRFAAYVNKPELIRIWSQVADTVLTDDVGKVKEKIPELEGGKDQDMFLPQSPSLVRIMKAVRAELERFENMSGQEKKENSSIPLTMYGIAKRAAIDPRLVDAEAPDEPMSKTNAAVKEIVADLDKTKGYKGTVAVFCDNQNRKGANGSVEFNIFDDMKAKLIKQGVPESQIAVIKSGMSIVAKQKIFDAVNAGTVRVIMGSTQTLGTGVNIQERLHLLIHMDAPDRPMDYTQRNGRIKRQGNLHKDWGKSIKVVRFGVEDSLDVTAYQRLKTKSGFIDSIMDGKGALLNNQVDRTVEEEEEGLFDNPVAVLSGSQYALKKNQAERELRKYQGKRSQWEADQVYISNRLRYIDGEIEMYDDTLKKNQKALEDIKKMFPDGKPKVITVEGVAVDMTAEDSYGKLSTVIKEKINDPVNAIVKRNRENEIYNDETLKFIIELDGHPIKFSTDITRESEYDYSAGRTRTIIHKATTYNSPDLQINVGLPTAKPVRDLLDEILEQVVTGQDFQDRIVAYKSKVEETEREKKQLQAREGQPFQFTKELEDAKARVAEYTEAMKKEMAEKEAKYAEQQKAAEAAGEKGFDLRKAEDNEDEDDLYSADEDWDDGPTFYSNAMKAVEGIAQEKATPAQWLTMITKAGGIKAGEDKWIGLSDWLKEQQKSGKKTLTKKEIEDFIRQNQIEIEDVDYSESVDVDNNPNMQKFQKEYADALEKRKNEIAAIEDEANAFNQEMYDKYGAGWANDPDRMSAEDQQRNDEIIERYHQLTDLDPEQLAFEDMIENYGEDFSMAFEINYGNGNLQPQMDMYGDDMSDAAKHFLQLDVQPINSTRLSYTTEGLENKKEIALTVPTIEPYNENDEIHFGDAGEGRAVAWVRFGETRVPKAEKIYKKVDKFDEPYKNVSGRLVYYPEGEKFMGKDYIVYGQSKDGKMVYVPIIKEKQIAAFDTFDEARQAMNDYYKENNIGETQYDRVLVIDEIQSKRHQDARESGYKEVLPPYTEDMLSVEKGKEGWEIGERLNNGVGNMKYYPSTMTREEAVSNYIATQDRVKPGVPQAPFEKNWHELAMKWMLRYAAENGYDKVAWTTGAQQAERYNIGNVIDQVERSQTFGDTGETRFDLQPKDNGGGISLFVKDGIVTQSSMEEFEGKSLGEVVGKDLALKMMEMSDHSSLEISDMVIGGEGMKGFYDQILTRFMDKYGKKWGVKTYDVDLSEIGQTMHAVDVTPEMKESVMQGQPMFRQEEQFAEGETFPIRVDVSWDSDILRRYKKYSVDLMPDQYSSYPQLLESVRRQYPDYYVSIEDDCIKFNSWESVIADANAATESPRTVKSKRAEAGKKNYVDRKIRNAINAAKSLAEALHLDNVEIKTDLEGLEGKHRRAKGFFNKKTGKIVLVLPNNANKEDLINTLLHEGVAHAGLRRMFGQHFDTFLDNIYRNVSDEIRARIDAAMKRNGWGRQEATEEYLARLAERTDFDNAYNRGWWQKIKDFFMELLTKVGLRLESPLEDNELRYILWRSYDNLLHPGTRSIFDKAKEVQMQSRLKVGEYADEVRIAEPAAVAAEPAADATGVVAGESGNEETLNNDFDGVSSQDLLLSLSQKEEDERNKAINELVRRVRAGEARVIRLGKEIPLDGASDAQIAGTVIAGLWQSELPQMADETLRGVVSGRPQVEGRPSASSKDIAANIKLAVISWAKASGHYYPEERVKEESLDKDVWRSGAQSRVYRTPDGSKVSKFMESWVYYENPLLKNLDGIALQNASGFEPLTVLGYSLDEFGELQIVVEQNLVDGVTIDDVFDDDGPDKVNAYIDKYLENELGLVRHIDSEGNPFHMKDGLIYKDIHGANVIMDKNGKLHIIDGYVMRYNDDKKERAKGFSVEDDVELYSDADDWMDDVARDNYEKVVASDVLKLQESWQDSMVSLKAIQDAIAKETGNVATGAEDAYHFENRMHGRAKNMTEQYDRKFYRPMLKAFNDFIKAHNFTFEQGQEYLIAKHGLERNVYYAMRDAVKDKLDKEITDERKALEKRYKQHQIAEKSYKEQLKILEEKERSGVDDRIKEIRGTLAYQRAMEDYQLGAIGYTEYLRRIESIIKSHLGTYDKYAHDYSGLTETFAKEMYDDAQEMKKMAQRAVDPKRRSMLWKEYDRMMKEAYKSAREVAEDAVFSGEDMGLATADVNNLWKAINAATEETLKESYESGLMSRDTYNKVRDMFAFYVPLRGWDEDKASDVYQYMGKDNIFSPAVKKTWGRTSKAENPLAYIGNIAVSTIISGHRNLMKQHFLNYVMNNPTSLVSISESWYENIGSREEPIWIYRSADTAGKEPDEVAQIVNDFNEEMQQKMREGLAMPVRGRLRLDVNATKGQKAEHVVEVQRAGRTYELYINGNPKAAQALNGSAARAVSRISDTYLGQKLTKLNRDMAMFFTSKNPAFVISNLSRDLNMAGASVAINEGAKYNALFIANVAKVLTPRTSVGDFEKLGPLALIKRGRGATGLMPKLMRKWMDGKLDESNETERLFAEFMNEGGETGFVNMLSIESFKDKMKKEIAQMNGSSLLGGSRGHVKEASIKKGLRLIGDTFEFYNRCAEDATRFIVYMTSRQMGKSLEQSIADAKDVTLNFNRKGTGDMGNAEVRDLFIFVNPAIQALANMVRMAKGHPEAFAGVTIGFIAFGAIAAIMNNWLLNMFGGDDDKDAYWNLPTWVRKNNLVVWVPGTHNFITIPLAQEFRVFYGTGEAIASYCLDHPHNNGALEIAESVADLVPINPAGNGGNIVIDFTPTAAQPILQLAFNTDFTGRPIWKENQGNKFEPMYNKAYVTTPKWMVAMSKAANDITGGDEDVRGWLERTKAGSYLNNPAVWNHLLQGYFGGMYNTIAKSFDVMTTAVQGEMPKAYQTPVLNRFINRPIERDNAGVLGEDYWELISGNEEYLNILRKKAKKAKDGDEKAKSALEKMMQSEDYHRSIVIQSYQSMIDAIRKVEKETTNDEKIAQCKQEVTMLKNDMMDELAIIDGGADPVEVAMKKFDESEDPRRREAIATRISKEAGASEDAYGGKPSSDHAYQYQLQRTAQDVWEDALLYARQEKLREEGKEDEKKTLSNERTKVHYPFGSHSSAIKLHGGNSDKEIMKWIRRNRKKLLDKYHLDEKKE